MSLVVEDGTGKANAEAYATVQAFKDYFNNRGVDITAFTPDAKIEQNLRKGADYMTGEYRLSWKGERTNFTQALDWPRYNVTLPDMPGGYGAFPYVIPTNVVPADIATANILLAYRANAADLAPDIDPQTKSEVVDVIEVEYTDDALPYTQYRAVRDMLSIYLKSSDGAGASLVRC